MFKSKIKRYKTKTNGRDVYGEPLKINYIKDAKYT